MRRPTLCLSVFVAVAAICLVGAATPSSAGLPRCGDSTIDAGEQCDDGNTDDGDCCSSLCQLDGDGAPW